MKRRGLFAGLLAMVAAKAQVMRPLMRVLPDGDLLVRKIKPANGECPCCGTVAALFVIDIPVGLPRCAQPMPQYMDNMGVTWEGPPPQYDGPHTEGVDCTSRVSMVSLRYDEAAVRCNFCNTLFVQDAVMQAK